MKKTLIIFTLISLFTIGCKKDNNDNININSCESGVFQVTLNDLNIGPMAIQEDYKGNIIIIGQGVIGTKLIKINNEGEEVWNKLVPQTEKKPKEILILKDNSIVVLFNGEIIKESFEPLFEEEVYVTNGLYVLLDCNPTYELSQIYCFTIKGELDLIKFDEDGNYVWKQEFDDNYAGNKTMISHNDSSFILLTGEMYGKIPEYVYDNQGVFQDTVRFPFDKNQLNIYNISTNGEIIWTKKLSNLFNDWAGEYIPYIDIIKVDDKYIVKSSKSVFYLDNSCNELERKETDPEHCDNKTYNIINSDNNSFIISGDYNFVNGQAIGNGYYTKKISETGELIWRKENSMSIKDGNEYGFFCSNYTNIDYYNTNGDLKWTIPYANSNLVLLNCNNGVTYLSYKENKFVLTSTNDIGMFQ